MKIRNINRSYFYNFYRKYQPKFLTYSAELLLWETNTAEINAYHWITNKILKARCSNPHTIAKSDEVSLAKYMNTKEMYFNLIWTETQFMRDWYGKNTCNKMIKVTAQEWVFHWAVARLMYKQDCITPHLQYIKLIKSECWGCRLSR